MHTTNFPWLRRALVGAVLCVDAASAFGEVYDVDTTTDSAALTACTGHANDCSLRGAIIRANRNLGWDTVNVPAGTYVLTEMGTNEDAAATGDLDITGTSGLTLTGVARDTVIDANHIDRVFEVLEGVTVDMSGLVIQGGSEFYGSGILNRGTLSMTDCALSGNGLPGDGYGGGILDRGTATLTKTTLSGNTGRYGAGIYIEVASQLTATNCTLSGNSALIAGGGIATGLQGGTVLLSNCTVVDNSGINAGGIYVELYGSVSVTNSIIATNGPRRNCSGPVYSLGYNLSDDSSCSLLAAGDLENIPAGTVPLGSYGGPTQTHALCFAAGVPHSECTGRSPAIDAGDNASCPATDQRNVARPQDGKPDPAAAAVCDIGAYEAPPLPCPDLNGDGKTDIVDALFVAQYTVGLRFLSCQMPTVPALMTPVRPVAAE